MDVGELAVMLALGIPIIAIIGHYAIKALKIVVGHDRPGSKDDPQETQLVQDIHRILARMEERLQALETVLLERPQADAARRKDS